MSERERGGGGGGGGGGGEIGNFIRGGKRRMKEIEIPLMVRPTCLLLDRLGIIFMKLYVDLEKLYCWQR